MVIILDNKTGTDRRSRGAHYEQAFAALLKKQRTAYIALDQARKAMIQGARLKSFDFIIYPAGRSSAQEPVLVELKGRKLSWRSYCRGHWGPTWAPLADIEGLTQWEPVFGGQCRAVFAFAYWLFDAPQDVVIAKKAKQTVNALPRITNWQGRSYVFAILPVSSYQLKMRKRSARWQTVYVPRRAFDLLAVPYDEFIGQ